MNMIHHDINQLFNISKNQLCDHSNFSGCGKEAENKMHTLTLTYQEQKQIKTRKETEINKLQSVKATKAWIEQQKWN